VKPDSDLIALQKRLLARMAHNSRSLPITRIMEVCGTHTMAIGRFGLRRVLPDNIRLISGPGCPVCVTPAGYIDQAIAIARKHGLTLAAFGDLLRVPGRTGSLETARAEGVGVEIILSPSDLFRLKKPLLFLATGFETTLAPIASVIQETVQRKEQNIFFLTSFKIVPPTLHLLLNDPEIGIDAFLLPGHVSAIIGEAAYGVLPVPSVIAGFECLSILLALDKIVSMKQDGLTGVANTYRQAVTRNGNRVAQKLIAEMLEPCDEPWRGIGPLPGCSLQLRPAYHSVDAVRVFSLPPLENENTPGCCCGDILKGKIRPFDCPLFAKSCTPDSPVGPCMVSSEGTCAAFYKYERTAP